MTIEQLRNLYNAQPFRGFVIDLADGPAVPVRAVFTRIANWPYEPEA
jgi:hypothetical protein